MLACLRTALAVEWAGGPPLRTPDAQPAPVQRDVGEQARAHHDDGANQAAKMAASMA